ncbi:hypothetical protein GCM10029976_031640 [Kribbella albertanoniae]|uniref:Uncharacterized protein n=1 Tax=Kribbella albertanoniae TaxID=1266829 RepID=A0A4V2XST9_9ACTN|nr:hypothetical protein [Kribbella albertanoniae]TDC35015.1 hypothetical protein E1261_02225 [Kribbella albertanoniae]
MRVPAKLAGHRGNAEQRSSVADDGIAALLGVWLIAGVYADGWAHLNVGGLDSFFTPWHGALYGGFTALTAWLAWMTWRRKQPGRSWRDAIPAGYRQGVVGVAVFAAGGVADMVWHLVFGVEAGVDALVSPTHLVLLVGGTLLLSSPLRAVLQRSGALPRRVTDAWPAAVSLATMTALAGFFLSYVSVFAQPTATMPLTSIPEGAPGHLEAELPATVGLAGYLIGTALIVVPLLLARRRGPLPAGTVALVVTFVAVPAAALSEMRWAVPAIAAVGASLVVELLLRALPAASAVTLAVGVPGAVWSGQLIGLALAGDLGWGVEMWAGVVVLTTLAGYLLAVVAGANDRPRTSAGMAG